jgi:hypothetical protein
VVLHTSAENTSKEAEKKEEELAKKKKTKYFKGLRQVFSGEILLTFKHPMIANTEQFFGKHLQQLLTIDADYLAKRQQELTDEMREDFKEMRDRLKTNPDQKRLFDDYGDSYVTGILLLHYKLNQARTVKPANPKRTAKQTTENIAIKYAYISNELDLSKNTFKEAIEKKHYLKNQCWINTVMEVYENNLLGYRLTHEKLLRIIDKTEDTVKKGLTIQDMEPFFVKFRVQVRIFDACYNCIYEYEPRFRNHNNKPLYALAKNNHIYTLNYNLKSLQQTRHAVEDEEDEEEQAMTVRASSDYKVIEDRNTEYCRMIQNIDDILPIMKEEVAKKKEEDEDRKANGKESENKTVYLVVENDEIRRLFFDLKKAGYEPIIKFECGRITGMYMSFNGINFSVRSQQLITSSIEREISIDCEVVFNRMNEEMIKFHDAIFKNRYKSYYNAEDIAILDEYRTVVNIGMIQDLPKKAKLVEIDVSKAFTSAFQDITKVPVFNEFDIFKPYNNEEFKDLSFMWSKPRPRTSS